MTRSRGIKRNIPWTTEELDNLPRVVREILEEAGAVRWATVAEKLGGRHSADACKVKYQQGGFPPILEMGAPIRERKRAEKIVTEARYTPATDDSPDHAWHRAKERTAKDLRKHIDQRFLEVTVDSGLPIALTFVSDQHIRTSGPVDLGRMESDARVIASTEGVYAILGGDGIDNHIKHHAAMVHGGSAPAEEWKLFDHYLDFFGDKILTVISGNHDDWTVDFSGFNALQRIITDRKLFFAPDEAVLGVRVGHERYIAKVRHQYRFNSQLNLIHTVKRLWEQGEDDFDIGVVCHHHEAALEPFMRHGRQVWGARPGSYQLTSGHSRRYGYNMNRPKCPTFILFPDQHEVVGFQDVRQGAGFLKWLRSDWPNNYRMLAA